MLTWLPVLCEPNEGRNLNIILNDLENRFYSKRSIPRCLYFTSLNLLISFLDLVIINFQIYNICIELVVSPEHAIINGKS